MSRDDEWILDIVNAAKLAISFVGGIDQAAFMGDLKTQAAVTRQIEIVGEAAKRLSEQFRAEHPEIPLREAAGMRDRIIHQYSRVNVGLLWGAVTADLPDLVAKLEGLVPQEPE